MDEMGLVINCDVCGTILNSFGCCIHGDEDSLVPEDHLCSSCRKAVKDAKEQVLKLLKKSE